MSLISMRNIVKEYKVGETRLRALDNVSLDIEQGEFVAIVGQSGSGKSTLMNILGCLDVPDKGKYTLNGNDILTEKESRLSKIRNREIGFIFQSFNLVTSLSAIENVELPLIYRGIKKNTRKRLAERALALVDLESRAKHLPGQLSGGQQQRVAIARAIASSPPLILADEPTGNLDVSSGSEIMNILFKLHSQGKTIIMITHDNTIAHRVPRRVEISDGKLV
ncbi:ABC transporter ATP-binding protein [Oscillospiraceae bacterium LCP25S3_E10]|nr:ABC transporter ATP-binding protein [Ruminococcus sp.]MDD6447319.1 ABC transporter ATP-binding protein [Ruminococcus sp.]MDY2857229.1 ABC transporter ATP-binding protein [Oscillospiraceae bacterium]